MMTQQLPDELQAPRSLPGQLPGAGARRRPNRAHLVHRYVRHRRSQCCPFTLDLLLRTIFAGRKVHHQQRLRIRRTLDQYVLAGLLAADHEDDGSIYYMPAYDPPANDQQALLRHELQGLLPEETTGDPNAVISIIDMVLDELG